MQVKERIFYNRNKIFWELFNLYHSLTYIIHKFSIRLDLHVLFTNSQSESTYTYLYHSKIHLSLSFKNSPSDWIYAYLYHPQILDSTYTYYTQILNPTRPTRIIHNFSVQHRLHVSLSFTNSQSDSTYFYHLQILRWSFKE